MFIKGVFGKTHIYALTIIFMLTLVDIWPNEPRFDIRKFQKYLGIFIVLFVGPSHFEIFFFVLYFFIYVLNLWTITLKCNYVVQCLFLFPSKKGK
jgi:hypothetical protein